MSHNTHPATSEDRPEWRETDEWIVPKGLTSPDSAPGSPLSDGETVRALGDTPGAGRPSVPVLGRDGGENDAR